jgi:L-fucose isomerase-like protein
MEEYFGCKLIFRSWKAVNERARAVSDSEAEAVSGDWAVHCEGVRPAQLLQSAKLYLAIKEVIDEVGGVEGVGANCLNESFHCDTTPCLVWNMLFERDGIIWACEGDTLTLLTTFVLYRALEKPIMMTNLYPFLVGMAALAHERIEHFPDIPDPDNHALGVHCGYFGFAPRSFCTEWTLRPKVLAIVNDEATMVDCRFPTGPVTLAKIYPGFKKLSVIRAEIEKYVQYPGSDALNGALIRYADGHRVMDELCSHHSMIIQGDVAPQLRQVARVFGWEVAQL